MDRGSDVWELLVAAQRPLENWYQLLCLPACVMHRHESAITLSLVTAFADSLAGKAAGTVYRLELGRGRASLGR